MAYSRVKKVNIIIGDNIKKMRKKKDPKMTQEDLAKAIKLTRVSIVNMEKGRHGLTMTHLIDISSALNVPITRLLKGL